MTPVEILAQFVVDRDLERALADVVRGAVAATGAVSGLLMLPGHGRHVGGAPRVDLASEPLPTGAIPLSVSPGGGRLILHLPADVRAAEPWREAAAALGRFASPLPVPPSEQERRWLLEVARSNDAMVVASAPDRRILWANPAFEAAVGKPLRDLIGQRSTDLWPASTVPGVAEALRDRGLTHGWARGEVAVNWPGKAVRWLDVQLAALRGPDGEIETLLSIAQDITARREALHDLDEAYRIARVGAWRFRLATREIVVSETARRMLQLGPDEPVTLALAVERIGDGLKHIEKVIPDALRAGRDFELQVPWNHPDGRRSVFLVRGEELRLGDHVVDVQGILIDVSDAITAAEEREQLQRELELAQRRESVGLLAGGVAHDFNNHLTAILAETALADGSRDEAPEALRRIEATARRLRELTAELLALSGRGELRLEEFCPDVALEETVVLARTTVRKRAELVCLPGKTTRGVRGDPTQFRQLVLQLLLNAGDAAVRQVSARSYTDGDTWVLEITDDGPGVPNELRTRVFEPFFTTKPGARGLGLSTAQAIALRLGGTLTLVEDGRPGATFALRLPYLKRPADPPEVSRAPTPGRRRVLVIDDDALVRRGMTRLLARLGHESVEASDGPAGLAAFDRDATSWDLVIVDGSMPGMHGLEVIAELRRRPIQVPIILASGYLPTPDPTDVGDGPSAWLPKPFLLSELRDAITRACGG